MNLGKKLSLWSDDRYLEMGNRLEPVKKTCVFARTQVSGYFSSVFAVKHIFTAC